MKFFPITEENIDSDTLKAQLDSAHEIGRVYLSDATLFVKKRRKVFYISYSNIHRAFRRVKSVPTRICCGKGEIRLEYLVLSSKTTELCEIDLPDERAATAVIEELQAKAPAIKIGKKD